MSRGRRGIATKDWGPHTWRLLHAIAHSYPESIGDDEKYAKLPDQTVAFFESLGALLPCGICREHSERDGLFDPDVVRGAASKGRKAMVALVRGMHNKVSARAHKPPWSPHRQEAFSNPTAWKFERRALVAVAASNVSWLVYLAMALL